jgi:hypothetical protein
MSAKNPEPMTTDVVMEVELDASPDDTDRKMSE